MSMNLMTKKMNLKINTMGHTKIKMILVWARMKISKFKSQLLKLFNLLLISKCCGNQVRKLIKNMFLVLVHLMTKIMKLFRTTIDMHSLHWTKMFNLKHKKIIPYLILNHLLKKKLMMRLIWPMKGLHPAKIWVKVRMKVLIFKWNKLKSLPKSNLLSNQPLRLIWFVFNLLK